METLRDADREHRPLIGVTGPDGWYRVAWRCSVYALRRNHACALRLTPSRRTELPVLDGLVIGGGDDVDPALYAGLDDGTGSYDRARDRFEIDVLERALERDIPVLGICRGAQLVNVVLGGSLHHQAIDRLGRGVRIVARDLDDLVQAIEGVGATFFAGVQWHPEYLPHHVRQRRLFRAFVDAARGAGGVT